MRPYLIASFLLAAACGDDPVTYSEPVGLTMQASSGDIADGRIEEEKNINTESGNPYGAFVANAEAELGHAPSDIVVEGVTLELDLAASNNIDALGLLFAGDTDVTFVTNSSGATYPVAIHTFEATDPAGPIDFHVHFDSDTLTDADYTELVGGNFKVVLSGPAAPGFAALNADADMSLVLTFIAYD